MCELIAIAAGETVLVSGPGAIGLTAVQVAKAAGARVIVSGTADDRARLAVASSLGADATVDVTAGDLARAVADFTAGAGVDVAVECAGNDRAVRAGDRRTAHGRAGSSSSACSGARCRSPSTRSSTRSSR